MLGRTATAAVAILAMGMSSAVAGGPSILPILLLAKDCFKSPAVQVQCAIQTAKGDRNTAVTLQSTRRAWSLQLGVTVQDGNDNNAYTRQYGKDQLALTVQKGDNNVSYISQKGEKQLAVTVQKGDGHWSVTAMKGEGGYAVGSQTN